ncbi:receptor-type tyrosine-protein phosphatase eta [Pimephales promelas]|nr:receptor-type tyrosine-protein phosphatase eta [Pimephales promelas]
MGQHYLLQASVLLATVLFAVLVSIPHVYSDCSLCLYKINPTSSEITMFVGDRSFCSVQNANYTNTSNSIIVTGLQPGNTYFLKINCSDVCCGNFSTNASITQLNSTTIHLILNETGQLSLTNRSFTLRPAQVENITVLNSSNSSLTVGWAAPPGRVDLYEVRVSELMNTTAVTNFTIGNLMAGRVYNITVTSVSGVLKNTSNILQAATKPNPPEALAVSGQTNVSISLLWSKPLSMDGLTVSYKVLYRSNTSVVNLTSIQTTSLNTTLTNLLSGSQYDITAVTIGVKDLWSSSVNLIAYTVPNTVQNLVVSAVNTNSVNLTWLPPNGNFNLFSYSISISSPNQTLKTTSNNYQITQLQPGTQYNCSIRTLIIAANISGPSQFIQCNTNPTSVSDLRVNGYTETSITLSWKQHDVQQSGYSYLLTFTHPNGTFDQKTVSNTTVQLLSLQSASQYNISIITQTADGTKSVPQFITACSKPFPVTIVSYKVLNVSAVWLNWSHPQEYRDGFSYQVLVSNCTENHRNLSTTSPNITVQDLQPGTMCQFSLYSLACGILGEPKNIFVLTKPSTVIPKLYNEGSNHSVLVTWDHPVGGLDQYILNISSNGWSSSIVLNSNEHNHTFTQLKAATVFIVTLMTVKAAFQETSLPVAMATYPNRPGEIKHLFKSNHSLLLQWAEAQDMTVGSFTYNLTYWSSYNNSYFTLTPNYTFLLDGLQSGTFYTVSVTTVGPMNFSSESVSYNVTTMPNPVQYLQVNSTKTNAISLVWERVEGVPNYVVRVHCNKVESYTTPSNSMTIDHLMPSTHYNISVQSSTSDKTEGEAVWLQACTDAAPVDNVTCTGPNLTLPMLALSWSRPAGESLGFEIKLVSKELENNLTTTTTNLNYNFTGLKQYNKQYSAMLWTLGCGKNSAVKEISCMTGFTRPVVPKVTAVSVSELQYNKFTLNLHQDIFNDTNGSVSHYGVLVSSGTDACWVKTEKLDQCQFNTYEDWKAKRCNTFLAVVKKTTESKSMQDQTIIIGDETMWNSYKNGELNAKGIYSVAVIVFTHLELNNSLVDVSNSFYSISEFSPITLPENPVVIVGAAAGTGGAAVVLVIIIVVVVCRRKQRKDDSISVPIHSIRNKVSDPIKVEDYEAYYKKQRADSFCGFAEEFEDLRPVGINQLKTVALAPENKAKNRYNNVLPYDSSRVKLSVLGNSFDDYINASYMPGYTSKKEFIAAQGPLPCTVNDFWRLIWEKNVQTIVMLTKCNEQGRVKCEEYWPADIKHFNNLTVMTTSEISLEDWTLRDFEVKNVKTAESRSVRHFHFTAWPDHGVPETTELLINFRHLVREHMDQYSRHSPTLVHCSAGVGRTGTFIAIDRLIFQIERDGVVDVYGIIHDLRMHRPLMVQTEDQYVFLNQCSMDIIKSRTGNNVDLIYQNTAALSIYENFEPLKKPKNGYHKA